jgi:hypothetical protein
MSTCPGSNVYTPSSANGDTIRLVSSMILSPSQTDFEYDPTMVGPQELSAKNKLEVVMEIIDAALDLTDESDYLDEEETAVPKDASVPPSRRY